MTSRKPYLHRKVNCKIQRNSKKSSFMRLSSSTRNISHNGTDLENIEQEMAKKDFNDEVEIGNLQFLNILDILKNEHYGVIYMFLKKPSPLSLRVKSKY